MKNIACVILSAGLFLDVEAVGGSERRWGLASDLAASSTEKPMLHWGVEVQDRDGFDKLTSEGVLDCVVLEERGEYNLVDCQVEVSDPNSEFDGTSGSLFELSVELGLAKRFCQVHGDFFRYEISGKVIGLYCKVDGFPVRGEISPQVSGNQ